MYSCTTPSIEAFITGPRYRRKKPKTSTSRMAASASMIATSLVNTDWRTCRSQARSLIASPDEPVPDPAHRADKRRLFGIVTELLSKSTDEDIDGSVVGVPVDAACSVQDSITTEHAPAIAHEHSEQVELGRRQ